MPEQKGKEIIDIIVNYLEKGKEKILKTTHIGKLKFDIASLTRKRDKLFIELGEKVYLLKNKGVIRHSEIDEICERIDNLNKIIREKTEAIADLEERKED